MYRVPPSGLHYMLLAVADPLADPLPELGDQVDVVHEKASEKVVVGSSLFLPSWILRVAWL